MRKTRLIATVLLTCASLAIIFFSINRASMNNIEMGGDLTKLLAERAEKIGEVPQMIKNSKSRGAEFERRDLLQSDARVVATDPQLSRVLTDGTVLNLDKAAVQRIIKENVEFLSLPLPDGKGGTIELELMRVNIFAPGFSVKTAKPTNESMEESYGVHYRGIVKGDDRSLAAISVFNHEVLGFFSTKADGNSVLGRLGGNNPTDKHIVYAERNLKVSSPFECHTEDKPGAGVPLSVLQRPETPEAACVSIYFEANFDIYQNMGNSVAAVSTFVYGLFNQTAALYNNDGISIRLSQVFVWNAPSPYTQTTSGALLTQFRTTRPTFNGDTAHLLTLQSNLGGIAALGILCNAGGNRHAFSGIDPMFETVPTYSWPVNVVAHEEGHNLNSEHTHACAWNGNMTAIDSCAPVEGMCASPGNPPGGVGGTIMSYCHTVPGVGVNFANGFGPQPRAVMQTHIANAPCATTCGGAVQGNLRSDFDGDLTSDIGVFRGSTGAWYVDRSTAGFLGVAFGANGDLAAPGDYDGDGRTDIAVFRPSTGSWYLLRSTLGFTGIGFGANGDVPAAGDFDGDGITDLAVFRPSNGAWYIQRSQLGFVGIGFGTNGDIPAVGDYDGDGKADIAVFRPSNGAWYIQRSMLGFTGIGFGTNGDKPVPADYDGDARTDVAVFRPSNGAWYLQRSQLGFTGISFGTNGDKPAPGDYDGDRRADVGVFRPSTGTWYIQRSTAGFLGQAFGTNGDVPTAGAYVP